MGLNDIIIGKLLDRGGGGTYETAAYHFDNTGITTVKVADIWGTQMGNDGVLSVSAGTYPVDASTTLWGYPSLPKALQFMPGAILDVADNVTLTIEAPIQAGRWRIFNLNTTGKVVLSGAAAANGVRPEWFGAKGDGTTDDTKALQKMAAALPAGARVILSARYRIAYTPPPVTSPPTKDEVIGIRITEDNVWIEGEGGAEIIMSDFNAAKAQEEPDDAGIDRFTAIAFLGVSGGGVRGVRFSGEATAGTNDALDPRVFAKLYPDVSTHFTSRAKAIGITNSSDISIRDVVGVKIVGNVVNARGDTGQVATSTHRVSVTGCYAEGCSENGFNYMGGTYDCVFADNVAVGNLFSGFESGTLRLTCTGNICRNNRKQGINQVGSYGTFTGNTLVDNTTTGFALQYQSEGPMYGDQNVLSGNVIAGNGEAGISAAASTRENLITGNRLLNNGPAAGAQGILLLGTSTAGTSGYVISGNFIEENRGGTSSNIGGVIAQYATTLNVTGNTFRATGGHSVRANGGSTHVYSANVANKTSTVSGTTGVTSTGNVGF